MQALGLTNFPAFEGLSNNGMKKKSHFKNLIKLYYLHTLPLSLSQLHDSVIDSPSFYFLLTDL